MRRPLDSVAILAAAAVSVLIVVNAVFLQSGSRSAPYLANPVPAPTAQVDPPPMPPQAAAPGRTAQPAVAAANDPIAQLIGLSSRIYAVQRVLSNYGYGQIKPTGVLDQPTSEAIARFEREHNMPVTGRISDRLVSDLVLMIGHPLN